MHCHLDLVGGLSGDMFVGTLLDAFPDLAISLAPTVKRAGFAELVVLETTPTDDGTLTGTKFNVHPAKDAEGHHHRHYSEIQAIIEQSGLDAGTRDRALDIFRILAVAEADVHGKAVEDVAFHEVGAWDSIADIVCAAHLIEAVSATWSVSSLPLGGGLIDSAHGKIPVPAPATALILKGFEFIDDGIKGERITPTGAAILKHLAPAAATPAGATLKASGFGFGTKKFPGISNVARLLVFEQVKNAQWGTDQVLQLEFEIDDQTAEDIAWAIDQLRGEAGVIDIVQHAALGKKGRQMSSIRLLAKPDAETAVTEKCFSLTTTLGVRRQLVTRSVLSREESVIETGAGNVRLKLADRPGGKTTKADHDDIISAETLQERRRLREKIENTGRDEDDR